jgi:hypothetical protein
MTPIRQNPPTSFRRHIFYHLPLSVGLAALNGSLLSLGIAIHAGILTIISFVPLLWLIGLIVHAARFTLVITPYLIVVDEGVPTGQRRIIKRAFVREYRIYRTLLDVLTDSGTLELHIGDETLVFSGLTPFRALCAELEVS